MNASRPDNEAIFHAARDIPDPGRRRAYVREACGGDEARIADIEALLAAADGPDSLLDRPAAGNSVGTIDQPTTASPGTVIGPYKLIEQIGEGGMGSVWMAQQTQPVKRLVAVKLIKAGMDSRQVIARFEAERQALALMDHPNIARVLDGGTTSAGRPYFVMDLVKGVPITRYCDAHHLTPRQRLELFIPVCQAIQHAHQKGIIHRDLKPSNVLVAPYDGKPVVKVIDFGVAKAAGQHFTDRTLVTGFGAVVGTLEYMSPEQAELNNHDIDTRSDIYSLGVLLYELLAGSPPFSRKELEKAGVVEMLRVIREQEPSKPSTKLSTADGLPTLAANRGTEPAKLTKLVRGELDWIVMKALAKERDRRYETANGFAKDIERFLNHEPVTAGPPAVAYRLRKFVRRNRGAVIAASLVLFALLAGLAGTAWQAIRAEEARADEANQRMMAEENERKAKTAAEGERLAKLDTQAKEQLAVAAAKKEREARQEEERQRKFAEAINRFVQDDFLALTSVEGQDRFGGEGKETLSKDTTLLELLDRAAQKLEARKDLDLRIEAELCWIIGVNYRGAGETKKAIRFLDRAMRLRGALLGRDHRDTLSAMNSLGMTYDAAGKFDKALPLLEEALKLLKAKLSPDHPDTLATMHNLAVCYHGAGKLDLALPLYEETLKFHKAKLDRDAPLTLVTMNCLAVCYQGAGKLDLALPLYEETLKLRKAKLGPDHPHTLDSMNNLAEGYRATGMLDLALPLYEETLKRRKTKLGPDHPDTLRSMNNLAEGYRAAGKLDLALPLYEQTLKLAKAKFGPDHPSTLTSMANLAEGYRDAGMLNLALPLYEQTLKLAKAKFGPDHPGTLKTMSSLAACYRAAGKLGLALPLFEETLKRQKAKLGPDHPDTLRSMNNLAVCYHAAGKLDLVLGLVEETLKLQKAKLGPDHPNTLTSMNNLAVCYQDAGKLDLALPLYEQTLMLQKAKLGPDHPDTLNSMHNLAWGYQAAGKLDLALPLYEETLKRQKAKLGPDHPLTLATMNNLAKAYLDRKQIERAIPLFEDFVSRQRKRLGADTAPFAGALSQVGLDLLNARQFPHAEKLLRQCLAIREKQQPEHWTTFNAQSMLGGALLGQRKYAEAEPVLLKGNAGMKAREKTIPPQGKIRLPEALDRLIELYTATGKPDEAKKWRAERAKYPEAKKASPLLERKEKK